MAELPPQRIEPRLCRTPNDIAAELKRWRVAHGWSLAQAEALAGMSDGHLSHVETPHSPNGRGLGSMSLPVLLDLYGLRILIVPADQAEAMTSTPGGDFLADARTAAGGQISREKSRSKVQRQGPLSKRP